MTTTTQPIFNIRARKVGGIWFLRLGRLQFSFCLCREVKSKAEARDEIYAQAIAYRLSAN